MKIALAQRAALTALLLAPAAANAQGRDYYPAFCQGMSIDGGENRMFISKPFSYPQTSAPPGGVLQEGTAGAEFAREVKRRSGKDLLDSVCHSRPSPDEVAAFADSTVRANGAGWTVETLDWSPKGARPLVSPSMAAEAEVDAPAARPSPAAEARAAAAERLATQRAEAAERLAAEQRAAAEALRAANAEALAITAEQTRKILEEKKAAEERLKQFQNEQRAYELAKAQHQASVQAAEAARRKWEADVAACRSGDTTRCGAPVAN